MCTKTFLLVLLISRAELAHYLNEPDQVELARRPAQASGCGGGSRRAPQGGSRRSWSAPRAPASSECRIPGASWRGDAPGGAQELDCDEPMGSPARSTAVDFLFFLFFQIFLSKYSYKNFSVMILKNFVPSKYFCTTFFSQNCSICFKIYFLIFLFLQNLFVFCSVFCVKLFLKFPSNVCKTFLKSSSKLFCYDFSATLFI